MRKQVFGRQFKRDKNERAALFKGLISAMILKGRIQTTEQKAKAIKGDLEKMITKAKKDEGSARRLLKSRLKPFEIEKMISEIAPGFKNRQGGYTRIIKNGRRFNDDASMVVMEWVEMEKIEAPVKKVEKAKLVPKPALKKTRKATKPVSKVKPVRKGSK